MFAAHAFWRPRAAAGGGGGGGSAPNNTPVITINQVFSSSTAVVAFTPGTNTGGAITGYKYRYANSTPVTGSYTTAATFTSTSVSIPGLDRTLSYAVQIRATNAYGDGPESAAVYIDGDQVN